MKIAAFWSARRTLLVRAFALTAFAAFLVFGPLREHTPIERLFAGALIAASLLVVLFASARVAFALLVVTLAFGSIALAGSLKFMFLTLPLLAPDLQYFSTDTVGVIGHYPLLLALSVGALVLMPLLLTVSFRSERNGLLVTQSRPVRVAARWLGTIAALFVLVACAMPQGPFNAVFNKPMWVTVNDQSFITDFVTSFSDMAITEPVIPADVDRTLDWKIDQPTLVAVRRPDVVAVLEESTFDPHLLDLCTLPLCTRRMFQADKNTIAHGPMSVHTFGGGTWTSEFSLLTSLAHTLFGNAGLYAPYNLAPRVAFTLPKAFKESGYRAIVLYPTSGDFLNARNAYEDYGFDEIYDGAASGLGWESHDSDVLAAFKRIYAKEKRTHPNQPLFIFMLTLHQHGPHMVPLDKLPAPYNQPLFGGTFRPKALDDWLNLNLANYLQRLQESDAMITDLEAFLFDGDRPALLLHFGDHQPSFDGAINEIPKHLPLGASAPSNWITYYMLKSNFAIRKDTEPPLLDITFLGSLLLDAAGLPKNAFYQANALLLERCKGRYLDCNDSRVVASYHNYIFNTLHDLAP